MKRPLSPLKPQAGAAEAMKVFVDRDSLGHIEGTTVDFVNGLQSAGFTFDNPRAKSSCSCGKSFG